MYIMLHDIRERDLTTFRHVEMDNIDSRESDLVVDLESGDTTSDENEIKVHDVKHLSNQGIKDGDDDEVAFQNESVMRGEGLNNNRTKKSFISGEGVKMINVGDDHVREKRTKKGAKKPPKPPRPPGGPSLNEADIKLVREISQLSRLRHARYERIKALKKMRADKASSSKTNVFAMIITILFICVIIFQGILGSHV